MKKFLFILLIVLVIAIPGSLWLYFNTTLERQANELTALRTEYGLNETAYQKLAQENQQYNFILTGENSTNTTHQTANLTDYSQGETNPLKKIQVQAGLINYLKTFIETQKKEIADLKTVNEDLKLKAQDEFKNLKADAVSLIERIKHEEAQNFEMRQQALSGNAKPKKGDENLKKITGTHDKYLKQYEELKAEIESDKLDLPALRKLISDLEENKNSYEAEKEKLYDLCIAMAPTDDSGSSETTAPANPAGEGAAKVENPQLDTGWINKGLALIKQGKFEEAIKCFDQAITINPNSAIAWHDKAACLMTLKKNPEAIKSYETALTLAQKQNKRELEKVIKKSLDSLKGQKSR